MAASRVLESLTAVSLEVSYSDPRRASWSSGVVERVSEIATSGSSGLSKSEDSPFTLSRTTDLLLSSTAASAVSVVLADSNGIFVAGSDN